MRYNIVTTALQLRYNMRYNMRYNVRYNVRYNTVTTPLQHRYNYRYNNRYNTVTTPLQHRYNSVTTALQQRYNSVTTALQHRSCSMCLTFYLPEMFCVGLVRVEHCVGLTCWTRTRFFPPIPCGSYGVAGHIADS